MSAIPPSLYSGTINSDNSELTYFKLPSNVFFWHTIILHGACLLIAILVRKIDVIFDLAGAICCAFSIFLFPAVGYLIAHKKYVRRDNNTGNRNDCGQQTMLRSRETQIYLWSSWVFLVLGIILIVMSIYINVLRATGRLPSHDEH